MKNIWIDTDPGLDDTLAIVWACHNEKKLDWSIKGISTVKGNIGYDQININTLAILEHLDRTDIPVYGGAAKPLLQDEHDASIYHGEKLGPFDPKPTTQLQKQKAPEGLANFLQKSKEQLTVVTLGPLTNIAIFLRLYPELIPQIDEIIIMGGGSYGNITHFAEFNIYIDPEAAAIVFNSGIPITMSGLDITKNKCYFTLEEMDNFLSQGNYDSWLVPICDFYVNKHSRKTLGLYDPTAMIAAAYPDKFEFIYSPVSIQLTGQSRGMTLIPTHGCIDAPLEKFYSTKVLVSTDREWFIKTFFEGFLIE